MNQPLTNRQREVAELVAHGFTNREIAERLCITEQTVKNHVHMLYLMYDLEDGMGHQQRVLVALDYWRNYGDH